MNESQQPCERWWCPGIPWGPSGRRCTRSGYSGQPVPNDNGRCHYRYYSRCRSGVLV